MLNIESYKRGGNVSLCLQVILYMIVVIKLFRKNEKLIKFSEKKQNLDLTISYCFGREKGNFFVQKIQMHSIMSL